MPGIEQTTQTPTYELQLQPHPRNPQSRIRILVGQDDGQDFAVQVPLRLRTVEAALDWLRPAHVPADALRQGEFFFLPSPGPHAAAGCYHPTEGKVRREDCGGEDYTEAGSSYRWSVEWNASFSQTHRATRCYAVTKSGDVLFRGRRRMHSHAFVARPRYFVRGRVEHGQHGTLPLPRHADGLWYEVIPNRAHGPFPVNGYGRGD